MRAEVLAFIACAFLCCLGVVLPAGELRAVDPALVQPTSISLYRLSRSKEAVRAHLRGYHGSASRKIGAKVLGKVAPHLKGRARSQASDAQDAMVAIESIRDEDLETVATIATVAIGVLVGLNVLLVALVVGADPAGGRGRGRVIAALVGSLITAALALGIHLVLRRVVAEANAEVGLDLFALRAGAYVIPAAAAAGPLALVALLIGYARAGRRRTLVAAPQ